MPSRASALDAVLHPVRLRILQAVAGRTVTTAQLADLLDDVVPATVYRHVSVLLDLGVLKVVAERRVRGAVERSLALDDEATRGGSDDARAMSVEQHRRAFAMLIAHLASEFDRFLASGAAGRTSLFGYGQTVLSI